MSAMPSRVVVAHPSALRRIVVPAEAGTQSSPNGLDSRLRGNDERVPRTPPPAWLMRIVAMALGLVAFTALWAFIAKFGRIPDPLAVFKEAVVLFSDPFYRNGPNDQGIGWNVLTSLGRVAIGFGAAAAVGIPMGFLIGRFKFLSDMAAPIVALLKPVSPLAWLPIGLLLFKAANPAAIYVIFVCSLWPMIVNTAVGVRQIPQDYLNVARVLNLSEWKVFTKILFPAVLPYMLTGVRLSIGIAWLVIVAAEMLTGGVGIGFFIWDAWNSSLIPDIIVALVYVGIVGFFLDRAIALLGRFISRGTSAN